MGKKYTVSDGKLVLTLEVAPEGGFVVTSPMDPGVVTEAESIDEAFANAREVIHLLAESRKELFGEARPRRTKPRPSRVRHA